MNEAEKLLYKYYEEDNFEIVDIKHKEKRKKKICYIFFSSNGLYKDRNDVDIIKKMHETGRYEWKFISNSKKIRKSASRIIFLRDVFKIFYIRGISCKNNTVDKIASLLKELTEGMDIIIAGSSAGAYMSLLIGNMLPNTKRIIALGGIADLDSFRTFSSYLDDNMVYCDYIDITGRLFGDYWIINFYGKNNNYDKHNGELIEQHSNKNKLINVDFNLDMHAPRPSGDDLIKLLVCRDSHLKKLKMKIYGKHEITETGFSMFNIGVLRTCLNKTKTKIIKYLKRNKHEKNH